MIKNIVAKRYSSVLVGSYAKKDLSKLEETIKDLLKLFASEPKIKEFFISPAIDRKDKLEVIDTLIEESGLDDKMHNFFKLLVENNRIFFLDEIFTEVLNAIHKTKDINFFKLETARKLNKKTINQIKKFVKSYVGGTIEFDNIMNKQLVGGFFVYNNDLALDGSVRKNLETFVKEL
ncbi:MAG: ATP synthase F1 subunit delta [Candidatus Cloacimonetes bacterium]|nr:ATP synthase F1 subunit delta [Candidatus Cloacimonadota bacterium]MBS3768547.1 ATP synthase F1 subunit delta [Candidatus Cloacimonadota bacterium]